MIKKDPGGGQVNLVIHPNCSKGGEQCQQQQQPGQEVFDKTSKGSLGHLILLCFCVHGTIHWAWCPSAFCLKWWITLLTIHQHLNIKGLAFPTEGQAWFFFPRKALHWLLLLGIISPPLRNERQKCPIEKRKRNLKKYSPISLFQILQIWNKFQIR